MEDKEIKRELALRATEHLYLDYIQRTGMAHGGLTKPTQRELDDIVAKIISEAIEDGYVAGFADGLLAGRGEVEL